MPKTNIRLIREVKTVFQSLGGTVDIVWVPAHCGVRWNEVADKLAKRGANNEFSEVGRHNFSATAVAPSAQRLLGIGLSPSLSSREDCVASGLPDVFEGMEEALTLSLAVVRQTDPIGPNSIPGIEIMYVDDGGQCGRDVMLHHLIEIEHTWWKGVQETANTAEFNIAATQRFARDQLNQLLRGEPAEGAAWIAGDDWREFAKQFPTIVVVIMHTKFPAYGLYFCYWYDGAIYEDTVAWKEDLRAELTQETFWDSRSCCIVLWTGNHFSYVTSSIAVCREAMQAAAILELPLPAASSAPSTSSPSSAAAAAATGAALAAATGAATAAGAGPGAVTASTTYNPANFTKEIVFSAVRANPTLLQHIGCSFDNTVKAAFFSANILPSAEGLLSDHRQIDKLLILFARALADSDSVDQACQITHAILVESPNILFRIWRLVANPSKNEELTRPDGLCGYRAFRQAFKRSTFGTGHPEQWGDVNIKLRSDRMEFTDWLQSRASAAEEKSKCKGQTILAVSTIHHKARGVVDWIAANHRKSKPFLEKTSDLWFATAEEDRTCWTAGEEFPYLLFQDCDVRLPSSTTHLPRCPCHITSSDGSVFLVTNNGLSWRKLLEQSSASNYIYYDGGHFMLLDSNGVSDDWRMEQALRKLVDSTLESLTRVVQESLLTTANSQEVRKFVKAMSGSVEASAGADLQGAGHFNIVNTVNTVDSLDIDKTETLSDFKEATRQNSPL